MEQASSSADDTLPDPVNSGTQLDSPDSDAEFVNQAAAAIELLESVREDRARLIALSDEQRARLLRVAGEVARPDPWAKRELARAARRKRLADRRASDESALAQTGIREKRREQVFSTPALRSPPVAAGRDVDEQLAQPATLPPVRTVIEDRNCYVCKQRFNELHFFYDSLCARCAELNWRKRQNSADLHGRVALVTGSRVKIGYQAAIMLLRAGARV
ncbi:MAG TPA: hypothetical protein VF331_16895, partial [Polyangiales bacterium]